MIFVGFPAVPKTKGEGMEYISFDIECCDGKHICEFGYVRVDEEFRVAEKECLLINPEHRITLSNRRSVGDMKLAFPDKEYYAAPTFARRYEHIRRLLTDPNVTILGFSLQNDVGFLRTACDEYGLPHIPFKYVDFQKLYRAYTKAKQDASVGAFAQELGIEDIRFHKSDDDAFAVVLGLKKIAEIEGLTLPQTLEELDRRKKEFAREVAREKAQNRLKKILDGNKKTQNAYLKNYAQKLKRNKAAQKEIFAGKWVCIGSSYQKEQFASFVGLLGKLAENGANYTPRTSGCQIFITFDTADDARYNSAQICAKNGKKILFLTMEEALNSLGTTEEELAATDLVSLFYEEPAELREYKSPDGGAKIGDVVSAQPKKRRRHRGGKKHKRPAQKPSDAR